ncbi:CaiB/BaiF CoA-transferase family protein [Pseudoclavibacter sp. RFBB5]|uniref:CaiB/BaiF CoA transferase family protein n=1 Tax=Pseudoclavibacter sp. RFBB5 TaxID=2080574 RepID=UPI000CE84D4E|nr:CoA transferase [Pseudoclavibacter sp. RFBB5]PPG33422.1 CoA transferase [Pseudoclavibacter sp. RFBB5]
MSGAEDTSETHQPEAGAGGGILSGIRVLDCSIAMAGPFAAQRLGDLGADVIKVEPPAGEWQRHAPAGGANGNEINVSFLSLNRNKRSIALDLKSDDGRQVLRELVATSDVFLQNYRPGVAARLGVDYETLRAINPSIVYVSVSGYGEDGPYRMRPGQDLLLQAMSGAMLSTGRDGEPPQAAGQYLVDAVTASTAFEGVLAALFHRERTGEGQLVTVNMLDAITTLQMQELSVFTAGGVPQQRSAEPHAHVYIRSPYGSFATSDGFIVLAMPDLEELGRTIGEDSFIGLDTLDDSWRLRDEVFAKTAARLATNTSAHWLDAFSKTSIWAGPVYGYADLVADPQIAHNGTFVEYEHPTEGLVKTPGFPYKFSKTPARIDRGAPLTGEHTREILRELGHAAARIEELAERGAIAVHATLDNVREQLGGAVSADGTALPGGSDAVLPGEGAPEPAAASTPGLDTSSSAQTANVGASAERS